MNGKGPQLQTVTDLIAAARMFDIDAVESCTRKLESEVNGIKQLSSGDVTPEFKIAIRRCRLLLAGSIRWLSVLQCLEKLTVTSIQQQRSSVIA